MEAVVDVYELNQEELRKVDGGVDPVTIATVVGTCYVIGYAAGKAYSHYQHSRNNSTSTSSRDITPNPECVSL